jgi:dTDP-4-dehydrorhamnose 3,5-epimerase
MDKVVATGITLEPLAIIEGEKGNIYHAIRSLNNKPNCFGEVYFSSVYHKQIKGWKKHTRMTLTLIVIKGRVKFYIYDDRQDSNTKKQLFEFILSPTKTEYQKLIIEPLLWVAFEGLGFEENILINFADINHDPNEAINSLIRDNKINIPYT